MDSSESVFVERNLVALVTTYLPCRSLAGEAPRARGRDSADTADSPLSVVWAANGLMQRYPENRRSISCQNDSFQWWHIICCLFTQTFTFYLPV